MRPWPLLRDFFALSLFFLSVYGFAVLGHAYGL